ncbi:D-alanyl-D-alanine carboxypeptidase [Streptomyces sp. RY43-2]|uniref:serine-type D-Ala-D-Ala carboxypeptidase n=1 Tax=Streptomyces macrolidinus TaxID=2952607 RepID=A0ABT0ZI56_9ACTN|nr:D-alanyl-D-alanine carboxypeptidase [Streptomyces macrolidinus]MCN9243241.1 D-alanyl-D-alanine carboxypeptidase [Streptomyces macrolidinus]
MAGESPDRSKQQGSSAEATSGSGAPVPGATRTGHDPRVVLTGEKAGEKTGADQATAVFSAREPRDAADSETGADAWGVAGRGKGTGDDGARRASLASWVRSAGDVAEGASAEAKSGAGHGGSDDASAVTAEDESAEAAEAAEAEQVDGAKSGSGSAGAAEAVTEDASEGDAESADSGADAKDAPKSEGKSEDESESKSEVEADAKAEEDSESEAETEADGASEAKGKSEQTSKAETEAKSDSKPEPDVKKAPKAETEEAKGDAKPDSDAKKAPKAEDDSKKSPDAEAEGEGDKGSKPSVDQPTAIFKVRKPVVDQPTTMLKRPDVKPSERSADEGEIDTPARKPGPAWAAKSAEGKPSEAKADDDKPKSGAPASDATSGTERTSKFVALKSLDEQAPAKPKPAAGTAEATTALPQVGPERTTQQPLPPKPPMDLLAELTNTPPPPETPVRTIARRIKIWTPLVVLLVIIFAVAQAVRPLPTPTLALTAKDSYTFDGDKVNLPWPDEGQGWMDVDGIGTMGNFGEQKPVPIGSVAKTMTAYIILRDHPLKPGQEGPKIKIDPTAAKEAGYDVNGDESTLNTVKEGDVLTEKQALSAVMIPSANNIARLLARWDAGSSEAFVKKMNDTAKELGMTNTTYTDPSGLTKSTVSTAEDQVKLGTAAMRIPAMVNITSAASWTDPTGHTWNNYNSLPYTIGAIGLKTGTTTAAGGNLLFATHKQVGGRTVTIVGAILAQYKGGSILDTVNAVSKTALLAAQKVPTSAKILKKGDVVGYVDDQLGGHTPVVVTKDVTAVGWSGLQVKLSFDAKDVPHTAKAGTTVGTLTVGDGSSDGAVKVPVALQADLVEPGFTDRLTRIG